MTSPSGYDGRQERNLAMLLLFAFIVVVVGYISSRSRYGPENAQAT